MQRRPGIRCKENSLVEGYMPGTIFTYTNVSFKRYQTTNIAYAEGEITNDSGKDYNTAIFRMSIYDKNMLIWSGFIKIRGFRNRQTRTFEIPLEGFAGGMVSKIAKFEIYFESGY